MKELLRRVIQRTPYRIIRARDANRFSAMDETLHSLATRGLRPRAVLDGGANVGSFASIARRHFPSAKIHLIEPQPLCRPALDALARADKNMLVHAVALGRPEGPKMVALRVLHDTVSTGAFVVRQGQEVPHSVEVPILPLDRLLTPPLKRDDQTLLKLDLEGYELEALAGAERTLEAVEVIICEVSFYLQPHNPSILEIMEFLGRRHFELHDIAALGARSRDNRAHQGDFVFVRNDGVLAADTAWM